jgi:hypothetical protein
MEGLFNPPYLSEMLYVDRVMEAMKTNEPRETALYPVWAFYEIDGNHQDLEGKSRICAHQHAAR